MRNAKYKVIRKGWWNDYRGKFYPNLKTLSDDFGVPYQALLYSLKMGKTFDEFLEDYQNSGIEIQGQHFKNANQLANYFNVSFYKAKKFFNGEISEKQLFNHEDTHIKLLGKSFPSMKAASYYFGISYYNIKRLVDGEIKIEDVPIKNNNSKNLDVEILGKKYNNWQKVVDDYSNRDLDVKLLLKRYRNNKRDKDLIAKRNNSETANSIQVTILGLTFNSIKDAAEYFEIPYNIFRSRLHRHLPDKYLLKKPVSHLIKQ